MKSNKTTITALVAAIALIASALSDALADGWDASDLTLMAGAVGLALQGFFSRDDDVTSEGGKAPKSAKPL